MDSLAQFTAPGIYLNLPDFLEETDELVKRTISAAMAIPLHSKFGMPFCPQGAKFSAGGPTTATTSPGKVRLITTIPATKP